MISIVVPYENPDLDGVACAMVLAAIEPTMWVPRTIGKLDLETVAVLDYLELSAPLPLVNYEDVRAIWLVDTHYPQAAPVPMPVSLVVKVTDHHPAGTGPDFPGAEVQNEAVGAAATLVTEYCHLKNINMDTKTAVLLQCAILSNTLDFRAPASSPRDERAYASLRAIAPINDDLQALVQKARRAQLDAPSEAIFERGVKHFPSPDGPVVISQIEAPGATALLIRPDIEAVLSGALQAAGASAAIWNIVDTSSQSSTVISTDRAILEKIAEAHNHPIGADGRLTVARILQRKTDIVPFAVP